MSEVDAAINDRFDSTLLEVLYSMDSREDIKDIQLGIVNNKTHERDAGGIEYRLAQLMKEAGPSNVRWPRLFLGGTASSFSADSTIRFDEADKRHFELNGVSLGEFLTQLVFDRLPIEWSNEGESSVKLSLVLENDYVLNLVGEGTFDTSYDYDEGGGLGSDTLTESEISYNMTFTADLLYCPNPNN